MLNPKVSLDQWRVFNAVVEQGSFARAANEVHKTQSSVSYAVQKIEQMLDIRLFEKQGRKAVLTPAGEALYRRSKNLLQRAGAIERGALQLGEGWDPELRLAVDIVFPTWSLLMSMQRFGKEHPLTRIQLYETVLGGTDEALHQGAVDLAISTHVPQGFSGDALLRLRFIAAARPDHPLHQLGRALTLDDLREHRHLFIRDSAVQRRRESGGWQGADQRWTVSHKATQIAAACHGLGFAWFPEHSIRRELDDCALKPLPLREGGERFVETYIIFADADFPTTSAVRMADIIKQDVRDLCEDRHRGRGN
jgi:DNA-binding transcriptional LysR family regulator